MNIKQEWENLLIDKAIAENYHWICGSHQILKISKVDSIIVSGLLIRAISILDYSLELYINNNNIELPNRNPKLFDRLKVLNDKNVLVNYNDIDAWRIRRNDVGHRVNEEYKWDELTQCLFSIFRELNQLNILNEFPELAAKKTIQRVPPSKDGIKIEQDIIVSVHDSSKTYYQFGWKDRV